MSDASSQAQRDAQQIQNRWTPISAQAFDYHDNPLATIVDLQKHRQDMPDCKQCAAMDKLIQRQHREEEQITLPSGSKRTDVQERYDLIPPEFLRRLALRYTLGAKKYEVDNWKKGQPTEVVLNHMLKHLYHYIQCWKEGAVCGDDDLAAIAWGCAALCYFEAKGKGDVTYADDTIR
jgi:hypothetical protein